MTKTTVTNKAKAEAGLPDVNGLYTGCVLWGRLTGDKEEGLFMVGQKDCDPNHFFFGLYPDSITGCTYQMDEMDETYYRPVTEIAYTVTE